MYQLPYEIDNKELNKNFAIDHVKPLATFDCSDPENQFEALNWTNCSPLLKSKNFRKGAKRNLWSEIMQELKVTLFLKLYYPESFDY